MILDLDAAIGALYDTSLEPQAWSTLGPQLCAAFDAVSFLVFVQRPSEQRAELFETNWSGTVLAEYASHYYEIDSWRHEGFRQPAFTPVISEQFLSEQDFVRREIYCDFARHIGIRHMLAEWAVYEDDFLCSIALHRAPQRGGFEAAEARQLGILFPHFLRSVRLRHKLQTSDARAAMNEVALDALGTGVAIVRGDGRVVLANRAATAMARRQDGFSLHASRLDRVVAGYRSEDTQRLRAMIAAASSDLSAKQAGGSLRLPSVSGGRGYAITVTPLPRHLRTLEKGSAPLALLLIVDLDCEPVPLEGHLSAMFGLTRAEARLAAALTQGQTRAEFAHAAGISINTVKTQLAQVFAKLNVSRESDLMRLVLSLPLR